MARRLGAHVDIGAVEANLIPVVTTTADSGAGSLRATLSQADLGATITFATNLSGQTITLNSGDLVTSKTVTINGSALAKGISISGDNNSRVLTVDTGGNATLIGLSLIGGNGVSSFAPSGQGGAVLNKGTLAITGCTISGNSAGFGGAIRNQSVIALTNCTLTGNSSPNEGGAYFGTPGSSAVLTHCTVSANDAGTRGGGIRLASATAAINNTIIAGNTLAGSATDSEANLVGSPSGGGNLINASPELAPLGNYGGPTQTMPPLPGSPAIDTASNIGLTTDQRGFTRPVDGDANTNAVPDIGAVEYQIVPLVAGTYNGLFYENDGVTHGRSGFFTAKATTLRKFSAKLNLAGTSISFSGQKPL